MSGLEEVSRSSEKVTFIVNISLYVLISITEDTLDDLVCNRYLETKDRDITSYDLYYEMVGINMQFQQIKLLVTAYKNKEMINNEWFRGNTN